MAGVESVSSKWETSLSVRELADFFKESAEGAAPQSRLGKFAAAKNARSGQTGLLKNAPRFADLENTLSFFTPSEDDSPFTEFETAVDFKCGASIPHKSGFPMVMHMHVTNDGERRVVELNSPYISKLGYTSSKRKMATSCMEIFEGGLVARDSTAKRH